MGPSLDLMLYVLVSTPMSFVALQTAEMSDVTLRVTTLCTLSFVTLFTTSRQLYACKIQQNIASPITHMYYIQFTSRI